MCSLAFNFSLVHSQQSKVHSLIYGPGPQNGSSALDSYFSESLVSWDPGQEVRRTKRQNPGLGIGKSPDTLGQYEHSDQNTEALLGKSLTCDP